MRMAQSNTYSNDDQQRISAFSCDYCCRLVPGYLRCIEEIIRDALRYISIKSRRV